MNGTERRKKIVERLTSESHPLTGSSLAKSLNVSRQVIVQDIAILRANGMNILSVHNGYLLQKANLVTRVFKVYHTDEQVQEELNLFVDFGGQVQDVFVYHKAYGIIKAPMSIKSRKDIESYLDSLASGKSTQLKNITGNYHYHTIAAEDEHTLDLIQKALRDNNFLAPLQEYEPIDFTKQ